MQTTPQHLARSALDAAPDAIVIVDEAGIIRFANRQVSALFHFEHDEIVGKPVEILLPERCRASHIAHRRGYASSLLIRSMGAGLDLLGRRQDGSEFPVEISLSPVEDVNGILFSAAIRDVSDRSRIEGELIRAREAAEAARELADRANLGKSRFLATASHDLRQPLQTLELLNGALRRRVTDPQVLETLGHQEQAIGSMSRLVNALLDISKLESGAIRPEPADFAVASIFEEMRREFASIATRKGLRLEVESCSDAVYSDPSLVEQIVRNLVSNAIKYTREGWVRLRCLHEATLIRIEVFDTGIGIPADQLPCIYDEFYQVGVPTNVSREGYGLGLSIVQRLVKLLTLKLDVRSEVGKGSAFSLLLPASGVQAITLPPTLLESLAYDPRHIGEARVLLVEDDDAVRRATSLLLELEGYHVTPTASLAQALQHVQQGQRVDLLITDYHLNNGETGTQVITMLREILGPTLKVVLTTGDTSSAIKKLPAGPFLKMTSKPIKAEELLALLRSLLAA